jgi:hypothetical protein
LYECIQALEDLGGNAAVFDQMATHPWYGFEPTTFSVTEQESLESSLKTVVECSGKLTHAAERLECLIPDARSLSIQDWRCLDSTLGLLTQTDRLPEGWWEKSDAELSQLARLFADAADRQNELDTLKRQISKSIQGPPKNIAELLAPAKNRFKSWTSILKPGYWRWRKVVRANLSPECKLTRASIAALAELCNRANKIEHWFDEQSVHIDCYLSSSTDKSPASMRRISESFDAASCCKKELHRLGKAASPALHINPETKTAAKVIADHIHGSNLSEAIERIDSYWPEGFSHEMLASHAPLPEVSARATLLLNSFDGAPQTVES